MIALTQRAGIRIKAHTTIDNKKTCVLQFLLSVVATQRIKSTNTGKHKMSESTIQMQRKLADVTAQLEKAEAELARLLDQNENPSQVRNPQAQNGGGE